MLQSLTSTTNNQSTQGYQGNQSQSHNQGTQNTQSTTNTTDTTTTDSSGRSKGQTNTYSPYAQSLYNQGAFNTALANPVGQQFADMLMKAMKGDFQDLPLVQSGVQQSLMASNRAMQASKDALGRAGLGSDPISRGIMSQLLMQGNQATAEVGPQIAQQYLSMIPGFLSTELNTGISALSSAAGYNNQVNTNNQYSGTQTTQGQQTSNTNTNQQYNQYGQTNSMSNYGQNTQGQQQQYTNSINNQYNSGYQDNSWFQNFLNNISSSANARSSGNNSTSSTPGVTDILGVLGSLF